MAAALVSNASALVAARPVASRQSARSSGFVGPAPTRFTASRVAIKAKSVRVVTSAAADGVSAAIAVNDNTFEAEVLNSKVPVLVDFWAPWCGPCRMIAPLIDELAGEYGSKIKAVKLNTDESPGVATEYGIRSIPTCMIFKDGQKVDTVIGAVPKSTLASTIDKYLD
mmetsp:Transcript_20722/g.34650  ORF Transcript_20722/g.34650 Transcript_20722/m.34650 type:complete len:168 (+) Transcript_20722:114-617(+)|eukprot:CAMPEP_0198197418 /NCGR_PEP_ID=MMETSP1445-20131203/1050_1 /TAXON_ID=36898 /ORGANISM="Pyramimonas sp., Strain CCMP2087" /LENGTH=167 /DNA_ID=CAMNT_0043866707 /DNA_START=114 /DNA_END=617 /DNA_ORIENTATION=-